MGKTVVGKRLATILQKKFIDLDDELEKFYAREHDKFINCRQIMQLHSENYYRRLERYVLQKILALPAAVIALGGGTVLDENNQQEVKAHFLLHIVATPRVVFARIMASGFPAFFDSKKDGYTLFIELWKKRSAIYNQLTPYRIDNSTSVDNAIHQAQIYLKKMKKTHSILLLHGINLNILGKRDTEHYGFLTLEDLENITKNEAKKFGYKVAAYQSNYEGALINKLQAETKDSVGIIINAGAFTHYSYGLHDALRDTHLPVIEVHLSDIHKREIWRKYSVIAPVCIKTIKGKKEQGYIEAVKVLIEYLNCENNP